MNKWKYILIIAIVSAIIIYALNALGEQLRQQQDTQQGSDLNKTIQARFDENFQRQNFLGNTTVSQVLNETKHIDQILTERTPLFQDIIENQRVIINNQYQFALKFNVSGVSNITH